MSKTGLDANFGKFNRIKGFKPSVLYYMRAYSTYDKYNDERHILKSSMTGQCVSNMCKDVNNNNGCSSIKHLKEWNILSAANDDLYYVVSPISAGESFRNIDTEFVKEMLQRFDSNTIMAYVWLHRKFAGNRTFALKDLAGQVLGVTGWNGHINTKVKKCLDELEDSGLISYHSKKIGKTILKELNFVREGF